MRVTFGNQTMKIIIGWQWWNYHTVQVSEKCLNLFGKELGEVQHIHHLHQLTRLNQKPNQHCRPLFSQCQVCFLRCQWTVNIFSSFFFLQKRVQNLLLTLLACHKNWYVLNFRILEILRMIYFSSSNCFCPVGCLSFVHWKKSK